MRIQNVAGVLCCGNICYDIPVWPVDRIEWNTTTWVETIADSIGGNGANTSYTLAKLGVNVRLIGIVSSDPKGQELLAALATAGVDTTAIGRSALPTTCTVALVHPSGSRAFLHRPGSSGDLDRDAIMFDRGSAFSHFHFANPFALPKVRLHGGDIMRAAREAGLTTSLDAGWDSRGRWIEDIGPCLPYTDLLFVNEHEGEMLTGKHGVDACAAALREAGACAVIVKLGERGCEVFDETGAQPIPGFAVKAIDSTGAGDCFAGAFLAALSRGADYVSAARLANAAGAMNVEAIGAVRGVRSYDETVQWMEAHNGVLTEDTLESS
jgi:sugar/nucleoside kinase (ribokinase family)